MNVKKIFKGVIGLGTVVGVAYAAYKLGECNGEINEHFRDKYGDDEPDEDDEDLDNYYGTCFDPKYDEPDDGCLAPANEFKKYSVDDFKNITNYKETDYRKRNFVPLSAVQSVPESTAKTLLLDSVKRGYITNKRIRDTLGIGYETADEIISEFQNAGYVSSEQGENHRFSVLITLSDYVELIRECRDN